MFLRNDTPGCVRHEKGDTFSEISLSYLSGPQGVRIPTREFFEPWGALEGFVAHDWPRKCREAKSVLDLLPTSSMDIDPCPGMWRN